MHAQANETADVANAVDFMTESLNRMSQQEIASRLTLNCVPCEAQCEFIDVPVTIIRCWDTFAISETVRDNLEKCYPKAKLAHLKTGGNFPFLTRSDEINLHILVRLLAIEIV